MPCVISQMAIRESWVYFVFVHSTSMGERAVKRCWKSQTSQAPYPAQKSDFSSFTPTTCSEGATFVKCTRESS